METDLTGFSNVNNVAPTRDTSQARVGSASLKAASVATGWISLNLLGPSPVISGFPVVAGTNMTFVGSVKAATVNTYCFLYADFFSNDAFDTPLGSQQVSTTTATTAGWNDLTLTLVPPVGAKFVRIGVAGNHTGAAG